MMMRGLFTKTFRQLLDLLFPPCCVQCRQSGSALCMTCLALIPRFQPPFCARCGTPLAGLRFCTHCAFKPLHLTGLRVCSIYQEPLRTYIHALKYYGNTHIAEPLGLLLSQTYFAHRMHLDLIVPVPLHPTRQRQRGYNQSYMLAEACSTALSLPLLNLLLVRTRETPAQVHLSFKERLTNMQDAFSCSNPEAQTIVRHKRILLIDDVCTTGATLEACAAPLFSAGAKEVWGLVLARPL